MNGFIKLHRVILDHSRLSRDNNAYIMFTKLLLKADRHTGTYITGRKKLAALCNLKQTTAWMTLMRLNDDNMVDILSDRSKTKITICNWEKYQSKSDRLDDRKGVDLMTKMRGFDDTKQEDKKKNINKQLLILLNQTTGRNFRVLPRGASKTLQDFTLEEIKQALINATTDPWHKEKLGELSSGYLLRSSTIDDLLNRKSSPKKKVLF